MPHQNPICSIHHFSHGDIFHKSNIDVLAQGLDTLTLLGLTSLWSCSMVPKGVLIALSDCLWRRGGVPRVNFQNIDASRGNRKTPLKRGRIRVVV